MSEDPGVNAPGVTAPEGADASPASDTGVSDAPPASEEVPVEEGVETPPEVVAGEENLPFGKHPRWIERNKQLQEYKEKLKGYETLGDPEALKGAMNLDRALREDPEKVYEWLGNELKKKAPANASTSPTNDKTTPNEIDAIEAKLDSFEPETASILKFLVGKARQFDSLVEEGNKQREVWEKQTEQEKQNQSQKNQDVLDESFDSLALAEGFIDKEGKGDEAFMTPLARHTMAELMSIAKNPKMPTTAELKQAFESTKMWMGLAQKKALAKKVTAVPPGGGSKNGSIPSGKQTKTYEEAREERIRRISSELPG